MYNAYKIHTNKRVTFPCKMKICFLNYATMSLRFCTCVIQRTEVCYTTVFPNNFRTAN